MSTEGVGSLRRYGQWAGSPNGVREDVTRCIESVYENIMRGGNPGGHQCLNRRGFGLDGLYCRRHAKRHPTTEASASDPTPTPADLLASRGETQ